MNRTRRSWGIAVVLVAAIGVVPVARTTARARAAACSLASTNGTVTRNLGARSYRVHVPAGLAGPRVPLLLSMHGAGGTASYQETHTGWNGFANSHKFVVAYPQGKAHTWTFTQGSADVTFLLQVVADISGKWCIDPTRVYSDGHSNGAYMSQRLACDAAGTFAAVVEYAGGSPTQGGSPCTPSRPIAVGLFQGEADKVVSPTWARNSRDEWVTRDNCGPSPASEPVTDGTLLRYTGCDASVQVLWRSYPGQGHLWPTGTRAVDQRTRMWGFLSAFTRP